MGGMKTKEMRTKKTGKMQKDTNILLEVKNIFLIMKLNEKSHYFMLKFLVTTRLSDKNISIF